MKRLAFLNDNIVLMEIFTGKKHALGSVHTIQINMSLNILLYTLKFQTRHAFM
jgi:hypothetical protein